MAETTQTHSATYDFIKMQWMLGYCDEYKLTILVRNGYITEAEKAEIMATPKFQY